MAETHWWRYVQDVSHGAQYIDVAARAGIDNSHLSRWKNGTIPNAYFVAKFARSYGRNVLEALIAAGYITEDEADLKDVTDLAHYTDEQLARELWERLSTR